MVRRRNTDTVIPVSLSLQVVKIVWVLLINDLSGIAASGVPIISHVLSCSKTWNRGLKGILLRRLF